ncbi:hypothetical protein Pcinc_020459, partial [Petrolisthes cinctipes]
MQGIVGGCLRGGVGAGEWRSVDGWAAPRRVNHSYSVVYNTRPNAAYAYSTNHASSSSKGATTTNALALPAVQKSAAATQRQ